MTVFGYRLPIFTSLILWCVLWEIVGRADVIFLIQPLSGVFVALGEVVQTNKFAVAVETTLTSFGAGMALAITIGVALGIAMGRVRMVERLMGPWVNLFVSAPLTALVPVIMILFGLGNTTIVVTVFLFAVWIIALDTQAGVKHISPSLVEMSHSFGASRWQLYSRIIVWAALPEIIAGIRMGIIRGVKGVVIGQLLVSVVGFGELFELYSRSFLMEEFWAVTIVVFAFAMILAELIGLVEKRVEY